MLGGVLILTNPALVPDLLPSHFSNPTHRRIWSAILGVTKEGGAPEPTAVLQQLREHGDSHIKADYLASLLDDATRAANLDYHTTQLKESARRRDLATELQAVVESLHHSVSSETVSALVEQAVTRWHAADHTAEAVPPDDLGDIVDPNVGQVDYLIDPVVPKGELTVIAASWKLGKSFISYSLAISAVGGIPVWNSMSCNPLRVMVWQLEMPAYENMRRLRKLMVGLDLDPSEAVEWVRSGRLVFYSQPDIDLASDKGVANFHSAIRAHQPDLVIIDSLSEAFCGVDGNDNSLVRKAIRRAFRPLQKDGRSVLAIHHHRKGSAKFQDSDRDLLLGSQSWGAAASRVYTLSRVGVEGSQGRSYVVRLKLTGSWSPEQQTEHFLEVEDVLDGTGTVVRVSHNPEYPDMAKPASKGELCQQAILAHLGRIHELEQKELVAKVRYEVGCSQRTVEDAIARLRDDGRVWVDQIVGKGHRNAIRLVPRDPQQRLS